MSVQFSLVVPTYNERANIDGLVRDIHEAMAGFSYELIVVDDNSPDGTADRARELSQDFPLVVLQRSGKLGLASAVVDGWRLAQGEALGVIDADGSHDQRILPDLVSAVISGEAELAVGSRYIPGGGMGNWPLYRQFISRVAVSMAKPICPINDLTSGYLVVHRRVLENVALDPVGFKIGLEVMMRGQYRTFCEVPYVFCDRARGASKLGSKEVMAYLGQLGSLFVDWMESRPRRTRVVNWRRGSDSPDASLEESRADLASASRSAAG